MRIPIFTDDAGWHGAQLKLAFEVRGVEAQFVSLQDCLIDLSQQQPHIQIPQFKNLPKAAFVRGVTGGTLPQVITRLNILHILKALGVNSFLLRQAQIATPPTWVCESRHQAHDIIRQQDNLVIKPLFGSQGEGVRLVESDKLPLPMDAFVDGVFYLQKFINTGHYKHDYRVFVVGNQAVAAMRRSGEGWLHNVAQGAQCQASGEPDVLDLAIKAAQAIDIAYCGVDIIRDADGKLWVLEVNSIPAWRGLQSATAVNVAQVLVDDFLSKV
jgi:tetrahydromethanopterin:alpha-L-glutamate ligase